jgi:aryl-alcohol dehydrogenase-like predicted oxidoreductase
MTPSRREFFRRAARLLLALGVTPHAKVLSLFGQTAGPGGMPTRPLGRTGHHVTLFSLGGEGVLRTYGRRDEAVRVITQALDRGVNYFDTAPAYAQSQDYYGEALGSRRKDIFLASKTHERSRAGALALLENSLSRLRTDHLDLWQLHDLRTVEDLDAIFGKGGAIEAVEQAKREKLIRFAGVTGHYDPHILVEAIRRYPFDTVLSALNAADRHYLSFMEILLPEAVRRNMGIIAMKVLARGAIMREGGVKSAREAISYVLSLPVSTALIGCSTPEEVAENAESVKNFSELADAVMKEMEALTKSYAWEATTFKAWP